MCFQLRHPVSMMLITWVKAPKATSISISTVFSLLVIFRFLLSLSFFQTFCYLFIYSLGIDGEAALDGPIEEVARMEAQEAEHLLNDFGIPVMYIF